VFTNKHLNFNDLLVSFNFFIIKLNLIFIFNLLDIKFKMSSKPSYNLFMKMYISAYPEKSKELQYKSGQRLWNEVKSDNDLIITTIKDLKEKGKEKKAKLLNFWKKSTANTSTAADNTSSTATNTSTTATNASTTAANTSTTAINTSTTATATEPPPKPAQQQIIKQIISANETIAGLTIMANNGLLTGSQRRRLEELISEKKDLQQRLKRLEAERLRSAKRRQEFRSTLEEIRQNPEVNAKLKKFCRLKSSRPHLEEDQPQLLKTIVEIVTIGAAADERRRSEVLRSCLALDDLVDKLRIAGYRLSRSATYLRLQPLRSATIEGKRHVQTVPIKLVRAKNVLRKQHPDSHFASATIRQLLDMAVLLGKKTAFVLSQDDKARVPLGVAAANKQSPILMHLKFVLNLK
jgi:hypothetical protein